MKEIWESILEKLEWLSKYGFIDIIFSIGIFTFLAKILKRKVKSDIEGVDLLPHISQNENIFVLGVKNQSNQPLYLYKAYIKPGHYSSELDNSDFWRKVRSFFVMTWKTDTFPKITGRPKTTKGFYILQVNGNQQNLSPALFIQPLQMGEYILQFDELSPIDIESPNSVFEKKHFGLLKLHFVHGTNSGQLELQL